ncbi:MAG: tRNA (N6-threonylcarbamoyladenosine(37)-N6)-methyltransferase TrmO [Clostridia bacterium]|nr:tRNA (N6-threonylcarbamoyladenosine(37)-N6)-methyltransferase TrmO [Clostridia bacterium]
MKIIAKIYNDYESKFGVPRQAGLVEGENSLIVFEPEYRVAESLRGIENSNYIWLIWEFSEFRDKEWSPTVRPPRLGGNKRLGVFATRSPHRPNPIGLSAVKLIETVKTEKCGIALKVSGADLMNGTPIYDIKPYIPYADIRTDAVNCLFTEENKKLNVIIPDELSPALPDDKAETIIKILAENPAPRYIDDPEREYGMDFGGYNIRFTTDGETATVTKIEKTK